MHIYAVHIDQDLTDAQFLKLTEYIDADKKARIRRFHKRMDAIHCLLGDLLTRYILCKHYAVPNTDIVYAYQRYGKAFLPHYPDLHFNISHSGNWVVAVVAPVLVGIDIEKIRPNRTHIAAVACSDMENRELQKLKDYEKTVLFFKLWTLKESYIKATGKGLTEDLTALHFSWLNGNIRLQKNNKPVAAYFETLDCIAGYTLSVCAQDKHPECRVHFFSLQAFYKAALIALGD
ncbi:4'-phosphopantetheinyl transferase family protein [Sphingobacterium sp. Mn56C]|uniref:4'-phosphopantetheinyl transferase family protein n=1 Tax=Sphingobacterium sp. Mn56C TaxID=3395261 RepID=UPI003BC6EF28